jgi:pyrroloquinoline quinone biosynthesis protein B
VSGSGARALVLGTAQDGGLPHAGCACARCEGARADPSRRRRVASIALLGVTGRMLLVDATPDLPDQLAVAAAAAGRGERGPGGLLLTHAHMGHYLGLAWFGREGLHARGLPVHATPRMLEFLARNRPWAHLLDRGEIVPRPLTPGVAFPFDGLEVEPFLSPHRAEDTDTIGVEVRGPRARLVYVPDADVFPPDVVARIRGADAALVDGTFLSPDELPRSVTEVPHPFVRDSVVRLAGGRGRIRFTHLNHTNPLADPGGAEAAALPPGFGVAADGDEVPL